MARTRSAQPTNVELEILNLLWDRGPCPLGDIHAAAAAQSDRAYSTTRKMLQVMRDKGLVVCDESVQPQLYAAARSRERTQHGLLADLTDRAFGGSAQNLVMSLLSSKQVTVEEVHQMQRLLQKAKGEKK
jgi:BlaI family transcriptional regulator, penicillinase repressor